LHVVGVQTLEVPQLLLVMNPTERPRVRARERGSVFMAA